MTTRPRGRIFTASQSAFKALLTAATAAWVLNLSGYTTELPNPG